MVLFCLAQSDALPRLGLSLLLDLMIEANCLPDDGCSFFW